MVVQNVCIQGGWDYIKQGVSLHYCFNYKGFHGCQNQVIILGHWICTAAVESTNILTVSLNCVQWNLRQRTSPITETSTMWTILNHSL